MKLFLALLALLTGFSAGNAARVAEPQVSQRAGGIWVAATAVAEAPHAARKSASYVPYRGARVPLVAVLDSLVPEMLLVLPGSPVRRSDRTRE